MKNEHAVIIRKASSAIGIGLLEEALEREGSKGCSPILCNTPVPLEPPYRRFNAQRILTQAQTAESGQSQRSQDERSEYLTFEVYPAEEDLLSISWMETMLRALSVIVGTFAFEVCGSAGCVWVRFAVACEQVAGLRAALLGHFPALRLRIVECPFPEGHPDGIHELVPVGPYHRSLTLLGQEGASPVGIAAQVISELSSHDFGLLQVLWCPADANHDWHYNIENMVEAEELATRLAVLGGLSSQFAYDSKLPPLAEPSVREKVRVDVAFCAVVVRYAVWTASSLSSRAFLQGMRVATGMLRFGNRSWRLLDQDDLFSSVGKDSVRRMIAERVSHRAGLMLTSREVASLVHIPNARNLSMLAAIQQRSGLEWQPPDAENPPCGTARLGLNKFAGLTRPVEIPMKTRLRHTYVAGVTGTGKSKLIERIALDDAVNGVGFCLVDPHGDLCFDVLSRLPEDRMEHLIYVSFSEPGLVPRWNPFQSQVPAGKIADDVAGAFLAQASATGARMEHNFRMLAYVVHELGWTLNDFAELAGQTSRGEALRERALEQITNPQVQRFLRSELVNYRSAELASVRNKLSRLLLDDQLGSMFQQSENTLHPRDWMDEGKIVLVNLAAGSIGTDHARFVGSLLVSLIFRAALSRVDTPPVDRRPFVLYIDEFQQLQAATLVEILSEGRKYALAAVLAHQERGQLNKDLSQSLGNAATKIVFRPTEDDLSHALRIFGGRINIDDLRQLGVGQALVSSTLQMASLRTELTHLPVLRRPRQTALTYSNEHYLDIRRPASATIGTRRPRVFDTFD